MIDSRKNKMGTEKMSALVLSTGVPLMLSLLINSLYNFVDSMFVSRVSEEALTALSLAAPVQVLVSALGLSLGMSSMAVTMSRQALLPLAFAWLLSCTRNLNLLWCAFLFAELMGIPLAIRFWKKGYHQSGLEEKAVL